MSGLCLFSSPFSIDERFDGIVCREKLINLIVRMLDVMARMLHSEALFSFH